MQFVTSMCVYLCSNLYQPQKLLSIGLEPPVPVMNKPGNALPLGIRDSPVINWQSGSGGSVSEGLTVFPAVAFLGTILVVVFLVCHFYKFKFNKPRRKRPKIKKIHHYLMYGSKVPGV